MTVVTASGVFLARALQALGPLAFRALRRAPGPEILRWGTPGQGVIDVLVVFEADALPPETTAQLRRLLPYSRRIVLARVVRSGGPRVVAKEAASFLEDVAKTLRLEGAELQLLYGNLDAAVCESRRRHEFGIILRSDQPAELFDGDGSRQEMRCRRGVSVA